MELLSKPTLKIMFDFSDSYAIVLRNNTPPASRQISALRGVTCFWTPIKSNSYLAGSDL